MTGSDDTDSSLDRIARDVVNAWSIRLRQWIGYDIPHQWLDSLTEEIKRGFAATPSGGAESEGKCLERLSDILTGGNASTWEQIFHAAEYHAACIKSSDAAMREETK